MLSNYENIKESNITITEFKLYDDYEQIYISTYNNGNFIAYSNSIFINKNNKYSKFL